ncbi:MAG TPA: chitooligosaccharide deacetylase [Clostridiales bacterium]|nr:chitooligosaccharide deacetylase [Clostridiales bacterium]
MKRFLCCILLLAWLLSLFQYKAKAMDHAVKSVYTEKKVIAFTFDDGPHANYTNQILDIFKEYGQKATFFVIGTNVVAFPEVLKRVVREGHELGSHTLAHTYITQMSDFQLKKDLMKNDEIIRRTTGVVPVLFRPPGGGYNDHKVAIIEEMGKKCILWNQDSRDWQFPSVNRIMKTLRGNLKPGDIVLFHDFNCKNSPTPEVLCRLIPEMLEQGYRFVTVSELMAAQVSQ